MNEKTIDKTILVIGPQPPPIGGGTVNVQILLNELAKYPNVNTLTINSSPLYHRKQKKMLKLEKLIRFYRIIKLYMKNIRNSDTVIVIGTYSFIFVTGYFFIFIAWVYRVSIFFKPLGAELFDILESKNKFIQYYMLYLLTKATGVMLQTKELKKKLDDICSAKTYFIPGYRYKVSVPFHTKRINKDFRILFLSQIVREKGPLLLLDAIRILTFKWNIKIICDFYGPVIKEDYTAFFDKLHGTPGAKYNGIINADNVSALMTQYSALIFPTYCNSEGHPGVIIEAMQAGIPVVSTCFPSAKELINDGENGFIVPVGNSIALAKAIKQFALDPNLTIKMGLASYEKGKNFSSDQVVSKMIQIMLSGSHFVKAKL